MYNDTVVFNRMYLGYGDMIKQEHKDIKDWKQFCQIVRGVMIMLNIFKIAINFYVLFPISTLF